MEKTLIWLLTFIVIINIAAGLETVYSAYTNTLDYVVGVTNINISEYNMTADWFFGDAEFGLTKTGTLIVTQLINATADIIPALDNVYKLGNSSLWWESAYIRNLWAININASEINTTDVNSENVEVEKNLSVAGFRLINSSNNLVLVLT